MTKYRIFFGVNVTDEKRDSFALVSTYECTDYPISMGTKVLLFDPDDEDDFCVKNNYNENSRKVEDVTFDLSSGCVNVRVEGWEFNNISDIVYFLRGVTSCNHREFAIFWMQVNCHKIENPEEYIESYGRTEKPQRTR